MYVVDDVSDTLRQLSDGLRFICVCACRMASELLCLLCSSVLQFRFMSTSSRKSTINHGLRGKPGFPFFDVEDFPRSFPSSWVPFFVSGDHTKRENGTERQAKHGGATMEEEEDPSKP